MNYYDQAFYDDQMWKSKEGAKLVLSYLFSIIGVPESLIDFGCGAGGWLKSAEELGVNNIQGIEGPWISSVKTFVPQDKILKIDMSKNLKNLSLGKYTLACSLEVAEHLPKSSAKIFIKTIANAADIVLFGAAIPGQGGVNHINEQYQSYWIDLFQQQGYECFDIVRPKFWDCDKISEDKRQNPLLYVRSDNVLCNQLAVFRNRSTMIDVIHPVVFNRKVKELENLKTSPLRLLKCLIRSLLGSSIISIFKIKTKRNQLKGTSNNR